MPQNAASRLLHFEGEIMEQNEFRELLQNVADGSISVDDALFQIKNKPFEDLGYAKPDFHRKLRQGVSEVIYGAGKTAEQIIGISKSFAEHGQNDILITRLDKTKAEKIKEEIPLVYQDVASIGIIGSMPQKRIGKIVIATGGTSDIPVAEEAALTAEMLGNNTVRMYDVGVAGIHRLLAHTEEIMTARVIVAIAGMEGALASVIGGLAECPVIAVPTSVGYGAAFGGLAALLSMLNSCASGVSVVNIDNGFGAAYQASMINHMGGLNE